MLGFHDVIIAGIIGLIGTIGVAMISGVISIVGLIISKEQKLSEFRQTWIDALRDDISHFVSHPLMISAYNECVLKPKVQRLREDLSQSGSAPEDIKKQEAEAISAFYVDMKDDYSKINIYSTRIKLRLNDGAHETESKMLLSVLKRMEGLISQIPALDDQAVQDAVGEIETISRPLLKKEWERVKKGEKAFQIAKYASLAVSCLLAVAIVGLFLSVPAYLVGYAAPRESSWHKADAAISAGQVSGSPSCPVATAPSSAK